MPAYGDVFSTTQTRPKEEIGQTYIAGDEPFSLRLKNMVGGNLTAGEYDVELLFSTEKDMGRSRFDLTLSGGGEGGPLRRHILLSEQDERSNGTVSLVYRIVITQGYLRVEIKPSKDPVGLCGVILRSKVPVGGPDQDAESGGSQTQDSNAVPKQIQ